MASVGAQLRRAREQQGRTLADISRELCIMQSYLKALEEDNIGGTPGQFFYKCFLKQYAELLKLPPQVIRPALENDAETIPAPVPAPVSKPSVPFLKTTSKEISAEASGPVRNLDPLVVDTNKRYFVGQGVGWSVPALLGVVLVCSGVYAWWTQPAAPTVPVAVVQQTSQSAARSEVAEPTVEVVSGQASDPQVAQIRTVSDTLDAGETHLTPDADGYVVLKLSATERTWLSITSANGKQIFSGVLEPSQSKMVTGIEAATVTVGNAAGLNVHWNGKSVGPLGEHGQVKRVRLTKENVEVVGPSEKL
jgi:cytoskeleton protein RodZ